MNERTACLGAVVDGESVRFSVWAPDRREVSVVFYEDDGTTVRATVPMSLRPREAVTDLPGCFSVVVPKPPGRPLLYRLAVDGAPPCPDPLSRSQPFGVHGASEVVAFDYAWSDHGFPGVALEDLIVYELHVGTATTEGTFDGLIPLLDYLRDLGVTAVELMPVKLRRALELGIRRRRVVRAPRRLRRAPWPVSLRR